MSNHIECPATGGGKRRHEQGMLIMVLCAGEDSQKSRKVQQYITWTTLYQLCLTHMACQWCHQVIWQFLLLALFVALNSFKQRAAQPLHSTHAFEEGSSIQLSSLDLQGVQLGQPLQLAWQPAKLQAAGSDTRRGSSMAAEHRALRRQQAARQHACGIRCSAIAFMHKQLSTPAGALQLLAAPGETHCSATNAFGCLHSELRIARRRQKPAEQSVRSAG